LAKALLKLTYDSIDHAIDDDVDEASPLETPRLRFVDAGLLFSFAERSNFSAGPLVGKQKTGGLSAIYLAEELIPTTASNKLVKFIHNGDAGPRQLGSPVADEIAAFLSFTQHIHW
jgi:hypothetical protein